MQERKTMVPAQKDWYQWVIYALCFAMGFITLGFCSSNSGLYLTAVTKALGMSRSAFSLRNVFRYIASTILSLFFGPIVARFGEKKITCVGIISLIGAVLTAAWAEGPALFYVSGVLLGIGFTGSATTMISYIIGRWCKKNRGMITGVVLSANGLGGAVAAQIVTPIIYDEANVFGYRNAYYMIAVMLVGLLIVVLAFLKEPPKREGEEVENESRQKKKGASWTGVSYQEVVKKPFFYVTLATLFCSAFAICINTADLSPLMTDKDMDKEYIALVLSAHSLMMVVGKVLSGVLFDKIGLRKTMLLCQICVLISMVSMLLVAPSDIGRGMAMLSGVTSSLGMPIQTVMVSCLALEMFGDHSYAKIMGICSAATTAGTAVGHYLGNLVYDISGSYVPILVVLTGTMVMVVIVFQFCMNASDKMRRRIEAKEKTCQKESNGVCVEK